MYSIRRRLLLVLASGFTLLIGGAGIYLERTLASRVTEEFDDSLVTRARALAQLTEHEAGHVEFDYVPAHMPEYERSRRPAYFEFWLEDGTPLFRSPHVPGDLLDGPDQSSPPRDLRLADGRKCRVVVLRFLPRPSEDGEGQAEASGKRTATEALPVKEVVLAVAEGRERLDALIITTRVSVFGVGGLAVLLAVLLVWRALAIGFRPIYHIADQVSRLDESQLAGRVGVAPMPRELAGIVTQLNALLSRLHEAFERERRFTGNVAHELRTPLAELRSLAEVAVAWPDDREAVQAFFLDVQNISGRMQGVITNLLLLARCQAGIEHVLPEPVNLRDELAAVWGRLGAKVASATLDLAVPDDVHLATDRRKLATLLENVLGNAAQYAVPDSSVRCRATVEDASFELEVSNPAERLSDEEMAALAEPFWRKESAGSSEGHAGLGLALVTALAPILGLSVSIGQAADGRFCVRIRGTMAAPQPILS